MSENGFPTSKNGWSRVEKSFPDVGKWFSDVPKPCLDAGESLLDVRKPRPDVHPTEFDVGKSPPDPVRAPFRSRPPASRIAVPAADRCRGFYCFHPSPQSVPEARQPRENPSPPPANHVPRRSIVAPKALDSNRHGAVV